MTRGMCGIVLPESVLTSQWFILLATVVAFNTVVYLGLTLAKLIPLPKQFHPSRVRRWLKAGGIEIDEDSAMEDIPARVLPETANPYENLRRGIAKRDIPQAFALVGGLIILLSMAAFITNVENRTYGALLELVVGLAFLLISQILGRRDFRARAVMWTWALSCVVLVGVLSLEAVRAQSQTPVAYALIVLTAFAPVTLAWRPSIVAAEIMFGIVIIASLRVDGNEDARLIVTAFAAIIVSFTLLRLRLVSLDALSDERAKSEALASTDVLTGLLTRNGLLSLMPGMAGIAERVNDEVCVMYFDINDLEKANNEYGVNYGDDVLRGVAKSIQEQVRVGDLVARWAGDEFLVAGLGGRPDAEVLAHRIQEAVRRTGVNLGRWPTTLKVGTAAGDPRETTFELLLEQAQAQAIGRAGSSFSSVEGHS